MKSLKSILLALALLAPSSALLAAYTPTPTGQQAASTSSAVVLSLKDTVGPFTAQATGNNLLTSDGSWLDVRGYSQFSIQIHAGAGISAGAIIFEQTNETTLAPSGVALVADEQGVINANPVNAAVTIAASTNRAFKGAITMRYMRVRISTAFVGGTVQATGVFGTQPYSAATLNIQQATAASLNVTASGTITDSKLPASAASADSLANPTITQIGADTMAYNNSTWDRFRNNFNTTTGDTGAKTATFNGATQTNFNASGAYIFVNVGTVSGTTPTMAMQLQYSGDGGTTWVNLGPATSNLTASSQTALLIVYPNNISQAAGATPANLTTGATVTTAIATPLPRTWRLVYTIGGTTPSFTITNVQVSYIE